jgi:hypothetical protein
MESEYLSALSAYYFDGEQALQGCADDYIVQLNHGGCTKQCGFAGVRVRYTRSCLRTRSSGEGFRLAITHVLNEADTLLLPDWPCRQACHLRRGV